MDKTKKHNTQEEACSPEQINNGLMKSGNDLRDTANVLREKGII